jgi:hypothetical protein
MEVIIVLFVNTCVVANNEGSCNSQAGSGGGYSGGAGNGGVYGIVLLLSAYVFSPLSLLPSSHMLS